MTDRLAALLRRKFVRDTLALQIGKVGITALTFLSSVLVWRLLGAEQYGVWALAQSFFTISQSLNLTGLVTSVGTQLPMAVGARDPQEILNLLAVYIKVAVIWALGLLAFLVVAGAPIARLVYADDGRVGVLAAGLALTILPDMIYNLILTTLQSQRSMRTLAVLQNINQLVLLVCTVVALLVSPLPESLVIGRIVYSALTMLLALAVYAGLRNSYAVPYPAFSAVYRRALRISPRPYIGFGFLNAVDKHIANLYTELPLQLVGIYAGKTAAGYLELAFKALTLPSLFTSAVFDNMQAVVPQAVGRRDFAGLRRNFGRVLRVMILGAVVFYAGFALVVPSIVPILFGAEATPAIPVIMALAVFGGVTMVGGLFGPLYRALNLMRPAVAIKALCMIVIMLPGYWLMRQAAPAEQPGALAGAWLMNGLFWLSTLLTAWITLRALNRR
jgi:O-antigen/teichoic acid export membrane protein